MERAPASYRGLLFCAKMKFPSTKVRIQISELMFFFQKCRLEIHTDQLLKSILIVWFPLKVIEDSRCLMFLFLTDDG